MKKRTTLGKAIPAMAFLFLIQAHSEPIKDLIKQAQNLSLENKRSQAVKLLVGALSKEKKLSAQKELQAALEQLSTFFYSDKAQQQYELALSLKAAGTTSNAKLEEAAALEPDNFLVLAEQVRLSLTSGDCSQALAMAKKWRELNPYFEPLNLAAAQAYICLGQFENFLKAKIGDPKKSNLALFWLILDAEYSFRTNQFARGRDLAGQALVLDPKFPEAHYWMWKLETQGSLQAQSSARKYIAACKTLTNRQSRSFIFEPLLCKRVSEVETSLKKQ